MEKDEILTASQIAGFTLKDIWRVRPKEISKGLLEGGQKKKDISLALKFMRVIVFIDEGTFGENDIELSFVPKGEEKDFFTGYANPSENPTERYEVYVESLASKAKNQREYSRIFLIGRDGKKLGNRYENDPHPSLAILLLSTAVHEVRHRLQYKNNIKMFSSEDTAKTKDEYLKSFLRYLEILFGEEAIVWREEGKSEDYIKRRTSPKEFDARLIEHMAANELYQGTTQERILEIIQLQSFN